MENVKHLIEVLKSQVSLYTELSELLVAEKAAITSWAVDKTVELVKKKEAIIRREKVQEEARNALMEKIALLMGKSKVTLSEVIDTLEDYEQKDELKRLKECLITLVTKIQAENLSLRSLYVTNSRLINDFFTFSGLAQSQGYGPKGASRKISTMQKLG